jgi:DNA modification methylase/ParB-like chromosome segregation protein Spo0J
MIHPCIHFSEIIIPPERQRQEFDEAAIMGLATSIREKGLFHAIQLRPDRKTLVSGERRLRAITQHLAPLKRTFLYDNELYGEGFIPYVIASSSDPLEIEEIELEENTRRKDLTWQETAAAHARLDNLRKRQSENEDKIWTHTDTASEIHGPAFNAHWQEETRKEIIVARHLDKPEVAAAPTLKDAFKVIKRLEDGERNRALALAVGETYSTNLHKAIQVECLSWMRNYISGILGNNQGFDVILTDPPYGMNAQDFGDGAGRLEGIDHAYDDSYESWQALMQAWCPLSYAITKPQAHAYIFCDIDRFHELRDLMRKAGWYVFRTPLTNYKQNSGRVPLPDKGPRRQSEWCLYAIKGDKLTNMIASDVIVTGSDEQLSHGAQKPVALYIDLLRRSVKPGDRVLDTFAGTGTIFPAAHEFKCEAVGVEQNPTYYGLCVGRLKKLKGLV